MIWSGPFWNAYEEPSPSDERPRMKAGVMTTSHNCFRLRKEQG
jgi:hypothetical protein